MLRRWSLDAGGAASLPLPMRRASMSATAPPFVPSNNPGFSRQSVPPVRSRTSALDFPAPPSQGPSCPDAHASVVVSGHSMSQLPYKQWPGQHRFRCISNLLFRLYFLIFKVTIQVGGGGVLGGWKSKIASPARVAKGCSKVGGTVVVIKAMEWVGWILQSIRLDN
jgi:hypothetical protein